MTTPRPDQPTDVESTALGDLIGNVARDLSTLMRQELTLARAELKQEATRTAKAASALTGAAMAAIFAVLFVSVALWAALSSVMHPGWAAFVVAVLWTGAAVVLYSMGRSKLRDLHPRPEQTMDTLGNVPDALWGRRGGTR